MMRVSGDPSGWHHLQSSEDFFVSSLLTALLTLHLIGVPTAQSAPQAPAPAAPPAQEADATSPAFKISGLVYADYYYVAANHRDELEDRNGFWLRRVYLTYDHMLTKALSLRVRLEANSEGDFVSSGVSNAYLKDAWLRWEGGAHAILFGMASTPQIEFVEGFQGYRSIEKTPVDLYGWDSSRDLGVAVQGRLGAEQRTRYALQVGNGSGTGSEVDRGKAVRAQVSHQFTRLVVEGYADWQDQPDGRDISTLAAFAGWREASWRASLEYGWQKRREAAGGGGDLNLEFLSAFATVRMTPRLAVVGRIDRNFDPIPDGETIDYLPFAETARSLFGYAALDVTLAPDVHLIPNVEWTTYGRGPDGTTPASDFVPRVTLFFSW
jgi:hypothetical protein